MKYIYSVLKRDLHVLINVITLDIKHRGYDEIETKYYSLKAFPKIKWRWSKHTYVGCVCGKHFYGTKTINLDNGQD